MESEKSAALERFEKEVEDRTANPTSAASDPLTEK
jgi:hypothetical protein